MTPAELACLWGLSPPLEVPLSLLREAGRSPPADVPVLLEAAAEALLARARVLRALGRLQAGGASSSSTARPLPSSAPPGPR